MASRFRTIRKIILRDGICAMQLQATSNQESPLLRTIDFTTGLGFQQKHCPNGKSLNPELRYYVKDTDIQELITCKKKYIFERVSTVRKTCHSKMCSTGNDWVDPCFLFKA